MIVDIIQAVVVGGGYVFERMGGGLGVIRVRLVPISNISHVNTELNDLPFKTQPGPGIPFHTLPIPSQDNVFFAILLYPPPASAIMLVLLLSHSEATNTILHNVLHDIY